MKWYKRLCFSLIAVIVIALVNLGVSTSGAEVVVIPDSGLEAAVREALDHPEGDITKDMMAGLQDLFAGGRDIEGLTGIEYAIGLKCLGLSGNRIEDLSPLAGVNMPALEYLDLDGNQISDLSPLLEVDLPALIWLDLSYNRINDLSGLSKEILPVHIELDLRNNQIESLVWLEDLPGSSIGLGNNQISDIAGLAGKNLPYLELLCLCNNQISDLSGLAEAELPALMWLMLNDNLINNLSGLEEAELPELEKLSLNSNHISNITELMEAELPWLNYLNLAYNRLNITPRSSVMNNIEALEAKGITVYYEPQSMIYGDVNGSGSIDVADAIMVLRNIVGLKELNPEQLICAMVNDGENLAVADAILILRRIVGLNSIFPVEQ